MDRNLKEILLLKILINIQLVCNPKGGNVPLPSKDGNTPFTL